MIELYFNQFHLIKGKIFLFSMLLFFVGYGLAPTIHYKNIRWLLAYPKWIIQRMDQWVKREWHPLILFLFLLSLNTFSLFMNLISGYVLFLPLVFTMWTGLNIGVVTYQTLEGQFYYASLLNPVALFELPAAFISFTLAIQYNLHLAGLYSGENSVAFNDYLKLFLLVVIPLLLFAAIIETGLILLSKKLEKDDE